MKGREVEFNQMFAQEAEVMAGSHPATTPFNTKVQVCFAFDNAYIHILGTYAECIRTRAGY